MLIDLHEIFPMKDLVKFPIQSKKNCRKLTNVNDAYKRIFSML